MPRHEDIKDYKGFLQDGKEAFMRRFDRKSGDKLDIDDFRRIRTLGAGSFGTVLLMELKKTGKCYAVKCMIKKQIVKTGQVQHTLYEKRILQSCEHPFLMRLEMFFMDNSNLYYVMPFVNGGEMFRHLRSMKKFDEDLSKFYAAQVVLGLEYLHYMDIVYRDLKPENIMIASSGYLKITDMGFCKIVKGRTYTFCGTPDYIAPEIILSKGYGKAVDWWSFGILMYEMSAGITPFASHDVLRMYEKITICRYNFPSHFSYELKDIVTNTLQLDLSRRYGNLRYGVDDFKKHPWFKHIDWLDIVNRRTRPLFVPRVDGPEDTRNFGRMKEKPLAKANNNMYAKQFRDF